MAKQPREQLAVLCRYHLPVAALSLKSRLNSRRAVDPRELRGKRASELLICNLYATVDDHVGSVAMPL
ncbi:hypothetical protein CN173_33535 [Sinorhizobium meliloti]|nr:hypothetical protein CN173_33535 [Sinorhizobium meliloti]